ncbi:hypothetical protein ABW636_04195 [Aquimarina sp. 2201CG1-2-11]|uniref:hypothetical protein n=1 Tax=Aquimarina discodermiae TaxID=3231043 RepID=UPI0034629B54
MKHQIIVKKNIILALLLILNMVGYSQYKWDTEAKKKNEMHRRDSSSWDQRIFKMDLKYFEEKKISQGIFPVPKYDLVGEKSFIGLGYDGNFKGLAIHNKHFLYNCFYAKKNKFNKSFIKDIEQDVFFIIVVSTDFIDTQKFSHSSSLISSRNHPNYLAKGYYKTKKNTIDFNAFISGDRDAYAIINERIFDLTIGKMIVIVPQKDGSLRSMQIEIPQLSIEKTKEYVENMLKEDADMINFYSCKGCI